MTASKDAFFYERQKVTSILSDQKERELRSGVRKPAHSRQTSPLAVFCYDEWSLEKAEALFQNPIIEAELHTLRQTQGAELISLIGVALFKCFNEDTFEEECPVLEALLRRDVALTQWLSQACQIAATSLELGLDPYENWNRYKQGINGQPHQEEA